MANQKIASSYATFINQILFIAYPANLDFLIISGKTFLVETADPGSTKKGDTSVKISTDKGDNTVKFSLPDPESRRRGCLLINCGPGCNPCSWSF